MKKELSYEQALLKAASLCSTTEYCISQMEEKLSRWGLSTPDIEKAICYLLEERYIDHERYSRAYAKDKFRYNHWGRIKISQMLRMQGVENEHIRAALDCIDQNEYIRQLDAALLQKARTVHDEDEYVRRGKIIRHLASRGYEMDLILRRMEEF